MVTIRFYHGPTLVFDKQFVWPHTIGECNDMARAYLVAEGIFTPEELARAHVVPAGEDPILWKPPTSG